MREKQGYRDVLEDLDAKFPDRAMLTRSDVAQYTGWSTKTVSRNIRFGGPYKKTIHKTALARQLI